MFKKINSGEHLIKMCLANTMCKEEKSLYFYTKSLLSIIRRPMASYKYRVHIENIMWKGTAEHYVPIESFSYAKFIGVIKMEDKQQPEKRALLIMK